MAFPADHIGPISFLYAIISTNYTFIFLLVRILWVKKPRCDYRRWGEEKRGGAAGGQKEEGERERGREREREGGGEREREREPERERERA